MSSFGFIASPVVSVPSSYGLGTSLNSSSSAGATSSLGLSGIQGLLKKNNEIRVRFIQNGWLA